MKDIENIFYLKPKSIMQSELIRLYETAKRTGSNRFITELVIDSIYLMDEKGRALDQNSYVLWNEYWDRLRTNLIKIKNVIDKEN